MPQLSNCYKILHLQEDCSDLQLRRRYRKYALQFHPDRLKTRQFSLQNDDSFFMKISDAYKQIVSSRKGKKKPQKHCDDVFDIQSQQPQKSFSFEDIRIRLTNLNKIIFSQQQTPKERPFSCFNSEINRVYDEHMSIINNLSQKLKEMRQH